MVGEVSMVAVYLLLATRECSLKTVTSRCAQPNMEVLFTPASIVVYIYIELTLQ